MSLFRKPNKRGVNCTEACEMMFDYLDGQMSADESARLSCHFEECAECCEEIEQRKLTLNLIKNVEFSVPDKLYRNVMSLVGSTPQDKKKFYFSRNKYLPLGTIAAACAVTVLVLLNRGINDKMFDLSMASPEALQTNGVSKYPEDMNDAACSTGMPETGNNKMYGESELDLYKDIESNSIDNRIYFESTAVLTLAPKITMSSTAAESKDAEEIFYGYLDGLIADHSDSAILVCKSDALYGILDDGDLVAGGKVDAGTKLYVYTAESADNAANTFTGYLTLLQYNGDFFESHVPEGASFTTYYILLVDSAEINSEVTE